MAVLFRGTLNCYNGPSHKFTSPYLKAITMSQFDDLQDNNEEYIPSRTAVKREMEALQQLGADIVELSDKYIARIPLQGLLEEAIIQARGMKHREGRRRQLQYIGKLMRKADNIEEIKNAYDNILSLGQEHNKVQQVSERWRERLTNDGNIALQEFLDEFNGADVQHLRQLIRNTQKEKEQAKPPASSRKLFRYIRERIEESIF